MVEQLPALGQIAPKVVNLGFAAVDIVPPLTAARPAIN